MHDGEAETIMKMPLTENGNPDYCLKCIGEMSIKCAWCGNPITIGSPITLHTPQKDYEVPEYAVRYTEGGSNALVGCLGWNCAYTGADMCGRWMPPGKVERMPSPLELCMASGGVVIVGDTHDPSTISVHPRRAKLNGGIHGQEDHS